jgi:glycosyltransferase involved in cell wall biosynthesis
MEQELINLHIGSFGENHLRAADALHADVTVCHQWPPSWTVPQSRNWVCMQPWEFGAIPRQWYAPLKYWTDQLWVYSRYNKECYVRCGIDENKIKVIPLGVDESIYHNNVRPLELGDTPSFRFLFVGGTIWRKGIDTLLQAYLQEFSADEEVCLVIKDFGTSSFYKGITIDKLIIEAASQPGHPRILYINKEFSEQDLAGLYKACDCLVHPYRGEGFGLPIIEAMACGTPAIVPNLGASQDFCDTETAFFIPCEEESSNQKLVGNLETVAEPWWLKTDQAELQKIMRFVYENRSAVMEKGQKASSKILSEFTWKQTANIVCDTLKQLVRMD